MTDIRKKVNYVLKQKQDRDHKCHWPGCKANCKPAFWGCRVHWFTLPQHLRMKIWDTYKIGQEKSMTPSKEYLKASKEVQKWIAEYLKRQGKSNADEKGVSADVDKGTNRRSQKPSKRRLLD